MALFKIFDILPREKKKGNVYLERIDEDNALMYADVNDAERVGVAANALVKDSEAVPADEFITIHDLEDLKRDIFDSILKMNLGAQHDIITLEPHNWSSNTYKHQLSHSRDSAPIVNCLSNTQEYSYITSAVVSNGYITFEAAQAPRQPIKLLIIY